MKLQNAAEKYEVNDKLSKSKITNEEKIISGHK
jgi:hypothetical protein